MTIHQVVVAAAPGDAVTASALAYRDLLRAAGPSEIFARFIDPALAGDVVPLEVLRARPSDPADRLLFHAAVGDSDVFPFIASRAERLTMAFHNLSPAAAFDLWDPVFAHSLREGRAQVAALAPRVERVITPSAFNARELEGMGYDPDVIRVVPLVVDLAHARQCPDAHDGDGDGDVGEAPPTVLFVGQQYPHKRVELLIETVHLLSTYLLPDARLVLVGGSRLPAYRDALVEFTRRLAAPVEFTGAVSDDEVARRYRTASVFISASDHEGFGVPVLEAMSFDVPVIVRDRGALAETAGGGALVLPADAGPSLLAEALGAVLQDEHLRRELVQRGRARLADVRPEAARAAFVDAVRP